MGKVVLITGGAKGIGRAIALELAKNQYDIVINYLTSNQEAECLKEHIIQQYYVRCLALKADVSKEDQVEKMIQEIDERLGGVDILINNAGIDLSNLFHLKTADEFRKTLDVNVVGAYNCSRSVSAHMLKQDYGRIINIASMYGLVGNTAMDTVAYHTSKGGVVNFTRAVAAELAKYNITCNAICPGYFETELTADTLKTDAFTAYMKAMVPLGRYGVSGELNAGAIFLASDEASYVTGVILPIDGGYTCV